MAIIRRTVDPAKVALSDEARARLDALSVSHIEANALADPDNPPLGEEELARGLFGRRVRKARERLGISQSAFAARFRINLRRLQDWEQGRVTPDSATLAYLTVIEREPDMVRRILAQA